MYLKKILKNKHSADSNIFFCDFETLLHENKHVLSCYSICSATDKEQSDVSSLDVTNNITLSESSHNLMQSFINCCFTKAKKRKRALFYFHNLGRFDGIFLLNYATQQENLDIEVLFRENIYQKIVLKDKTNGLSIEFRDTFLLLPLSLDKLAKTFTESENKTSFDFNYSFDDFVRNPGLLLELEKYCLNDSIILREGFLNYCNIMETHLKINPLQNLTISSLALKCFRTHYYDDKETPVELTKENTDAFIRKSYKGGVVDVYKPYIKEGFHYDINSLYPYVMYKYDMPIKRGVWQNIQNSASFDINSFFGFLEVEVQCPVDMYIPFLTVSDPVKGLISPTGEWTGVYFSEEIKYATSLGYTFKYIKGVSYAKGKPFSNYVESMYEKRKNTKRGSALNVVLKLLMNSLYGRFGMGIENMITKILPYEEDSISSLSYLYDNISYKRINKKLIITQNENISLSKLKGLLLDNKISSDIYMQKKKEGIQSVNKISSAVQIASAITSYARLEMHKIKLTCSDSLAYSDTDSIFCGNALDPDLISETALGKLKLEGMFTEGYFLSPKTYGYKSLDSTWHSHCKGIGSDILSENDIKSLYLGDSISVLVPRIFIRGKLDYNITSNLQKIVLKISIRKRHKIYDTLGNWKDTASMRI